MGRVMIAQKTKQEKINRPVFLVPPPHPKKPVFLYIFCCCIAGELPSPGAALSRVPGAGLLRSRPFGWGRRLKGSRENDARDTGAQHFEGSKSVSGRPSDPRKGNRRGTRGFFGLKGMTFPSQLYRDYSKSSLGVGDKRAYTYEYIELSFIWWYYIFRSYDTNSTQLLDGRRDRQIQTKRKHWFHGMRYTLEK